MPLKSGQLRKGLRNTSVGVSAIPDSGSLHARYDATELSLSDGQTVSTWGDETGNGHDLTAGTAPTYRTGMINGNPIVRFDGVDDILDVAWSAINQPNHVFIAGEIQRVPSSDVEYVFDGESTASGLYINGNNDDWQLNAGSNLLGGTPATGECVLSTLLDGANSELRRNGSQEVSGDAGSNSMDGLTVASQPGGGSYGQIDIGEILVYYDSVDVAAVESYLSDKWGIAV